MRDKLTQTRTQFDEPTPLYNTGRIAAMAKKGTSPWAVMNQAVNEYKQTDQVTFTIRGKQSVLRLGLPKSPGRRKRIQVLRQLTERAEAKGATDVQIDW